MDCDKCLLRKVEYNKTGHIIVCSLPLDKTRECKIGKKSHYVSIIKENKDEQK